MTSTRRSSTSAVRLVIDHELCSGSAHCRDVAPEVFQLADNRAWIADHVDLTGQDPARLRQAAASCPWFAISYVPPRSNPV